MSAQIYNPIYRGEDSAAAEEFDRLRRYLNNLVVMPAVYNAAPAKARKGLIVVADGDDWDPATLGTSEPYLVWFNGTSWEQLAEVTGGGVTDHGALTGLSDADHPIAAVVGLQTNLNSLQNQINANSLAISGKVTVFRQASPPTATAIGDIWFDTDDQNHEYIWSGSAWVSVRDLQVVDNEVAAAQAIANAATAQAIADGKVTTYYASSDPTGAPDFIVPSDGDLWFDTSTGNQVYRWAVGSSQWINVQDQDIIQALADSALAQATADGKIQTFIQDSEPVGDLGVGDIWFETDDNNEPHRYSGSTWVSVRDQLVLQASADALQAIVDAAGAQATADGKVQTFFQSSTPSAEGVGDLWVRSSDQQLFRASAPGTGNWVSFQDSDILLALTNASLAQATADGKIQTFRQTSAPSVSVSNLGDLWLDSNDADRPYRFNGASWVDISWITGISNGLINTSSVAVNAISAIASAYTSGQTVVASFSGYSTVQQVTINPLGGDVIVSVTFTMRNYSSFDAGVRFFLENDTANTTLISGQEIVIPGKPSFQDNWPIPVAVNVVDASPVGGNNTYILHVGHVFNGNAGATAGQRFMQAVALKR